MKRNEKLNVAIFSVLLLAFCAFTNNVMAQGNGTSADPWPIKDGGGNGVRAYVSGSTLHIEGSGNMADFWSSTEGEAPWSYQYYSNSSSITNVVIQDGVTNIGDRAFHDLKNLQAITIPNSVTKIGRQAFYNCTNTNLQINIPNSVIEVEGEAFRNCSGTLTIADGDNTLDFSGGNYTIGYLYDWFKDSQIHMLHLGRNCSSTPFKGMTNLQTLTIGNKVTLIGSQAFNGCNKLNTVTLQNGTVTLRFSGDNSAGHFNNCPIEILYLGRNLQANAYNTNGYPFAENSALKTLTIGNDVTTINDNSFYNCTGLQSLTMGNALISIGSNVFYGCSSLSGTLTIPEGVKTIGSGAFQGCRTLPSAIIPNSITEIGSTAFNNCLSLKTVNISNGTITLRFSGDNSSGHFKNSPIETLYLGRNLQTNAYNTNGYPFANNSDLKTLTIGGDVTTVNANSFYNCTGLTAVHSKNPTPPTAGSNCFYDVYNTCKLYVPGGAETKYKAAAEWKKFFSITSAIIPIKADNITIQSLVNGITIETKEQLPVSIYNLSGQKIYESIIAGNTEIQLDKGIYIVRANNTSAKVVVP